LAEDPELADMMKPLDADSIERQLTTQIERVAGTSRGTRATDAAQESPAPESATP
jgi:hypothetical protein